MHPDTVPYLEAQDVPEICTRRKRMKLAGYRVARLLFYAGNGFLASCDVRRWCIPYTQCTRKISRHCLPVMNRWDCSKPPQLLFISMWTASEIRQLRRHDCVVTFSKVGL